MQPDQCPYGRIVDSTVDIFANISTFVATPPEDLSGCSAMGTLAIQGNGVWGTCWMCIVPYGLTDDQQALCNDIPKWWSLDGGQCEYQ